MQTKLSEIQRDIFIPNYWVRYDTDYYAGGQTIAATTSPGTNVGIGFSVGPLEYDVYVRLVGECRFVHLAACRAILEWYQTAVGQLYLQFSHGHASPLDYSSVTVTYEYTLTAGNTLACTLRAYTNVANQLQSWYPRAFCDIAKC